MQCARSIVHVAKLFSLANDARLLTDPDRAAYRMRLWLEAAGVHR